MWTSGLMRFRSWPLCALLLLPQTALTQAQEWRASAQHALQIGELEGDPNYLFERIVDALRLSNGTIVVAMGAELRYYDASGKYLLTAGRKGNGPGEFYRIEHLSLLPGDTVMAWDATRKRVWFNASGKFVRQQTVLVTGAYNAQWALEQVWPLPNGKILVIQNPRGEAKPPIGALVRPPSRFVIYNPKDRAMIVLGSYGGIAQVRTSDGYQVQPIGPHTVALVNGDRIYIGDSAKPQIDEYSQDGAKLRTLELGVQPRAVTKAELDDWYQRMRDQTSQRSRPGFERGWAQVPKPRFHPYFWGLVPVDGGGVWVAPGDVAFLPVGRRITIRAPQIQRLRVGPNYMIGIWRDDQNVEYLRVYTITAAAAPPSGDPLASVHRLHR
jgi:hypothetical protein